MRRGKFLWEGPKPSIYLWKKMLKTYCPRWEKDKVLKVLTISDLLKNQVWLRQKGLFSFSGGGIYFKRGGFQRVVSHCSWDHYLLKKGISFFRSREVCQLRGVGVSGSEVFGPLQKGGESSVGNLKECLSIIESFKVGFKQRGDRLSFIELSHIHPSLEIIEKRGKWGTEKFIFNGLSQSDFSFQKRLFNELRGNYSLRLKAILPHGHSYSSQLFKSSHRL